MKVSVHAIVDALAAHSEYSIVKIEIQGKRITFTTSRDENATTSENTVDDWLQTHDPSNKGYSPG